jgi:dihydroxyacetone kinase-like predicted kinase
VRSGTKQRPFAAQAVHQELSRYRYCTTFVIEGERLDATSLEAGLDRLGDSLLVVGDPSALKVHVHTDDPGAASLSARRLARSQPSTSQTCTGRPSSASSGCSRPSPGRVRELQSSPSWLDVGTAAWFESLGAARIVQGGQTMNPPTADLLAAVDATGAEEVVLLPNKGNVALAAAQAARLAGRPVSVVPTRSVQAGLAALVAFNPERSAEENAAEMQAALRELATGEVTIVSRDASVDGVTARAGDFLGLVDEHAVVAGQVLALWPVPWPRRPRCRTARGADRAHGR